MQQKGLSFGKLNQSLSNMQQGSPWPVLRMAIWKCENKLRKYILHLVKKPLEEPLTSENIIEQK